MIKRSIKDILFITSTSLATNPRLVKELRTCVSLGHRATVISFSFENWSKPLNDLLISEFKEAVSLIILPSDRKQVAPWLISSLVAIFSKLLLKIFSQNLRLLSNTFSKRSWLLLYALKKQNSTFDWVIAHNPGAFVPAYIFSKKHKIKFGIDIEDYHPGEIDDQNNSKRMKIMMRVVLSHADVITAASPLTLEKSKKLDLGNKSVKAVINNVFSIKQQPEFILPSSEPLKLIWFSQTIGLNRGIQDVIVAMNTINRFSVKLTILGYCLPEVKHQLMNLLTTGRHEINFLAPVHENELIMLCSQQHIGLALEIGTPLNRDICLTNKLFTYLLAGNAIIATETSAQKKFFDENNGIGQTFSIGDSKSLATLLEQYATFPETLENHRMRAYQLAKTKMNWENESVLFKNLYGLN